MKKMSKEIIQKYREVYDYIENKTKDIVLSGKTIDNTCYAVIFNKKNDFSLFPIPLDHTNSDDSREALLKAMGAILKENKVKVKLFMIVAKVATRKIKDKESKECLMFSARDYLDNEKFSLYERKEIEGKISLPILDEKTGKKDWNSKGEKTSTLTNPLLNTIWKEYRKIAKNT